MITRKDVAARAGVSLSVVSRALNNSGYVDTDKKKRVLEAAKNLGYYPHPVAMSLQQKRTGQILYFCRDLRNSFNIEMYQGMVETARRSGYMVVFNSDMEFEEIRNTMIDGIIMPNEVTARDYLETVGRNYHLPVVSASYARSFSFSKAIPVVEVDMFRVMELAVKTLRNMGHCKIAFASPFPWDSQDARTLAFKNIMRTVFEQDTDRYYIAVPSPTVNGGTLEGSAGHAAGNAGREKELSMETGEDFFGKGMAGAGIFMEKKLDATAVVCFNDEFALGMMREFQERNVAVPGDISILGIDGAQSRKYLRPLLTSVSIFPEKQGARCADLLLDLIEGRKVKYVTSSPFRLLEGETVRRIR